MGKNNKLVKLKAILTKDFVLLRVLLICLFFIVGFAIISDLLNYISDEHSIGIKYLFWTIALLISYFFSYGIIRLIEKLKKDRSIRLSDIRVAFLSFVSLNLFVLFTNPTGFDVFGSYLAIFFLIYTGYEYIDWYE